MTSQEQLHLRREWALRYVESGRLLRIGVLVVGLSLSLFFASFGPNDLLEEPFVLGLILFAVATGLTCTAGFKQLQPWIMTLVPLLDIATISLFDLIPRAEVVDALIALPAMWLGLTLRARGVAVAPAAVGLLVITPGLLTQGAPMEGWSSAISITLLAGLAAAGMTVSTEVWQRQLRRLEHQGRALERAVEVKGDFIALVSHELRTPLTSIVGYLEMLDDLDEPIPEEALPYLAAVSRNADRLWLLVTDLLAASEVEKAPMRLTVEPIDVAALLQLSLEDANQRASEAGLSIVGDLPPGIVITADPNRLLQVLDNLLSNAIKFTPRGGQISVTLLRHDTGVDLVVTDTGVGIDEHSLPRLATKFFRTPQTTQAAIPGVGLGLMITKTIVEAHNGTLTFTSRVDQGTTVRVHLPADAVPTPAVTPKTPSPKVTAATRHPIAS